MIPERTRGLISYLRMNVDEGFETMKEARRSGRTIGERFTEAEQLLLGCALSSRSRLRRFDSVLSEAGPGPESESSD